MDAAREAKLELTSVGAHTQVSPHPRDVPAILSAQPHGALMGFRVKAEEVLEAAAGEGAAAGAAQGSSIRGALAVPVRAVGASDGHEAGFLLFL